MKSMEDIRAQLRADPAASLDPWMDPVWCATTPAAETQRLAEKRARRVMEIYGVEDPRMEALLVRLASQVEQWAAEERATTQEADDEAWVSAVPDKGETARRSSRLALVGTVLFVLGVLCGVVLATLRLR
ncbi:hypothetical protein WME90_04820 [Sorangium sp. So ce375]|uniref:hypothetical protein n=1 Tax=Sorangium sp. So ce375 TaxID=3133306 RepID=UPI003F5BD03A